MPFRMAPPPFGTGEYPYFGSGDFERDVAIYRGALRVQAV